MQCEDNSKLRIPLPEVCQTTDIGCVPITDGKPTCSPQPDELPIAFDEKTTTLWLFSCDTREWIPFQKFNVCQLNALNLDNITNICDILNIAVNYSGSGECKQGTITLGELAERILECLKLETKIITIGEGEGNKVKITIEGLPLDPVYVTGRNIWSEGGSGTEADPLKVATYDPICKWPTKNQAQVDAANTKHLGACIDGEMSRVPFPPKICELPSRNQAQVDAAASKELIACVDGEGVKVPFPPRPCEYRQMTEEQVAAAQDKNLIACVDGDNVKVPYPGSPCSYPQLTPEQMMAASDKDFIACVNGQNVKVPVPGNLYSASPCQYPQITLEQAQNAGSGLTIVGCNNGGEVRIPVSGSGFFDRDYICVPETNGKPTSAPLPGTGPLRADCDGTLWVWLCNQSKWEPVRVNGNLLPKLDPDDVSDLCKNFRMMGWYSSTGGDPCVRDVYFTLNQLADMIFDCFKGKECWPSVELKEYRAFIPTHINNDDDESEAGPRAAELTDVALVDPQVGGSGHYGNKIAIYNWAAHYWEFGSGFFGKPGRNWEEQVPEDSKAGYVQFDIVNDTSCKKWASTRVGCLLGHIPKVHDQEFCVSVVNRLTKTSEHGPGASFLDVVGSLSYVHRHMSSVSWFSKSLHCDGRWNKDSLQLSHTFVTNAPAPWYHELRAGQTINYTLHTWLIVTSRADSLGHRASSPDNYNSPLVKVAGSYVNVEEYRSARLL